MKQSKLLLFILLSAILLTEGCGYHFSGGGQLPKNVTKICVQVFENKTSESGLEHTIANEIIYYFTRFKNVALVDKEAAQAVLSGVVLSESTSSIAHKSSYVTTEERITLTVDIRLTSSDGNLLWKSGPISDGEDFQMDQSDSLQTEENKKSALTIVTKRLAERIYYLMTDNF